MSISMETKKAEAIKRMKALDLFKPYITLFEKDNKIFMSEMTGGVYEFDDNEELVAKVKEFEEEYNALVYHVIHTFTEFGELYSFLYVSDYEEEWDMDNASLEEGYTLAYVWNKDCEWCSEFGSVGIQSLGGGITRFAQEE